MIVDINMPGMTGYQLLQKLKQSEWRQIPVIMHSTSDRTHDRGNALAMGAAEYWIKAPTWPEMVEQVPRLLDFLTITITSTKPLPDPPALHAQEDTVR